MNNTTKTAHIPSLDLLRGIAALGVCFFHTTSGLTTYLADDNLLKIVGKYGHHGIHIFFVVSGFVIPYSLFNREYRIKNFMQFLLKRTLRIEPPYLATIVLMLGLHYLSSLTPFYHGQPFAIDWIQVGLHLGYLTAFFDYTWINAGFWTLAIEFQYYLLMGSLFPLLVHGQKWVRYAVLAGFCALSILVPSNNFVFHYSTLFTVGILVFQYKSQLMGKIEFIVAVLLATAAMYFQHDLHIMIVTLLTVVTILSVQRVARPFIFLGSISYSLYLLHSPIGGRVLSLSANFVHDPAIRNVLIWVSMIVSVVAAWIFFRLIEVPALKLSKKIDYRQREREKEKVKETELQEQVV